MSSSSASLSLQQHRLDLLRERVSRVPDVPGVYRWMARDGRVLYVGKAKRLRRRMQSYLRDSYRLRSRRTRRMRELLWDMEYTLAGSEMEALALEMHTIRRLKPLFNILLTRSAHFCHVRIGEADAFPSVTLAAETAEDGAKYFGPYSNPHAQRRLLELLRPVYRFRTCPLSLHVRGSAVASGVIPLDIGHADRSYPCLDAQIGLCDGPCAGTADPARYRARSLADIVLLYEGDASRVTARFVERLRTAEGESRFTRLKELNELLSLIRSQRVQHALICDTGETLDAFGMRHDGHDAAVTVLAVRGGRVTGEETFRIIAAPMDRLCTAAVNQYYTDDATIPSLILLPTLPADAPMLRRWLSERRGSAVRLLSPARGERRRLLRLADENAREKLRAMAER